MKKLNTKGITRGLTAGLLACLLLQASGCAVKARAQNLLQEVSPAAVTTNPVDDSFRQAYWQWSARLLSGLETKDNLLISPLSLLDVLAMAALGSEQDTRANFEGVTGLEVETLCGYLSAWTDSLAGKKLSASNSLWVDEGFQNIRQSYLEQAAGYFHSGVYRLKLDSSAVPVMNEKIRQDTQGMIPEALKELPQDTALFLANVLYFADEWEKQFPKKDTRSESFTNLNGQQVTVDMMQGEAGKYLEDDSATGFWKTYQNGFAFVALLPREEAGFSQFVQGLQGERLQGLLSGMMSGEVKVSMPKFELQAEAQLLPVLKAMGLTEFLSEQADFGGIDPEKSLYIQEIYHKTAIRLEEEGTRASAFSGIAMGKTAMPMVWTVTLDRPFVYMIVDTATLLPVFMGTVSTLGGQ